MSNSHNKQLLIAALTQGGNRYVISEQLGGFIMQTVSIFGTLQKFLLIPPILVWAFAACSSANAQGLGTIVGTVTDPSGGVLPSVTITVIAEGTSAERSVASNAQGYYVQKGITLLADQSVTANVGLKIQQAK